LCILLGVIEAYEWCCVASTSNSGHAARARSVLTATSVRLRVTGWGPGCALHAEKTPRGRDASLMASLVRRYRYRHKAVCIVKSQARILASELSIDSLIVFITGSILPRRSMPLRSRPISTKLNGLGQWAAAI
jgi:hypothetical protein